MSIKKFYPIMMALSLLCAAGVAWGNELVNGDFENTVGWGDVGSANPPPGWSMLPAANPAGKQSGTDAIGGAGTSAYMPLGIGKLLDVFVETFPQWQLDIDFACEDPGGTEDRSLNSSISKGIDALITFRVNGDGALQVYERGGREWYTPGGLAGSIDFDDDVQTTPLTHHLTIVGHFDLAAPSYDVIVTDAASNVYQALGLTSWNKPIVDGVGVGPTTGDGITKIEFPTTNTTSDFVFDNISVISGLAETIAGDADRNGVVDAADAAILAANWLSTEGVGWGEGDFNDDGIVDDKDATMLATNWTGSGDAATPEPGLIVLVLGGLICLLICKRR